MPSVWTTPKTWADQDPTLYTDANTYIRDNALYLYDRAINNSGILIASTTVAAAASYTFSSIPATYKHLTIRGYRLYTITVAAHLHMRFNADAGNNYSWANTGTRWGVGAVNGNGTITSYIRALHDIDALSTTATDGTWFESTIMDYASSVNQKNVCGRSVGSLGMNYNAGEWTGTAAINSLTLLTSTTNNFWGELELWGWG